MNRIYRKFYRNFYMRTNGFIPTKPLNQSIFPGDFFQIKNGEIILLGNIFRNAIIDPDMVAFGYDMPLNPSNWDFSSGVTKAYSGRETDQYNREVEYHFNKQILAFNSKGSFFFRGHKPKSVKILNWTDIQEKLIIKLTQTQYSFREVYVVTESVTTSHWTLALASSKKAELEIASNAENLDMTDTFGHSTSKTIQSKDIEYYHRKVSKKPSFFKAKKLVVQDQKLDVFISDLIRQREYQSEWANSFYEYDFQLDPIDFNSPTSKNLQTSILDMLQANQLNPNTALAYFKWCEASLNDIESLFLTYGN